MSGAESQTRNKNRKTVLVLSGVVLAMFGFGFAMVPLYDLFCSVTGIQSISIRSQSRSAVIPDGETATATSRWVTVKFDTSVNPNLPWDIQAGKQQMKVHPGQTYNVNFVARNRSSTRIVGQAIPSIAPWQATPYFSKLECFCFNKQTLTGGETTMMPLRFMVSPNLPDDIQSLTLSYSFLKLQDQALVSQNQ